MELLLQILLFGFLGVVRFLLLRSWLCGERCDDVCGLILRFVQSRRLIGTLDSTRQRVRTVDYGLRHKVHCK